MTNFEFRGLHHWQVGRLLTIEDAGEIVTEFAIPCDKIRTITHQPARFGLIAKWRRGAGMGRT